MIMREAGRYVLAGGLNTAATYVLYLLLMRWLDYRAAYVLAFVAGVLISFTLLRRWVFARAGRPFSLAYVAASQCLQLALGLLVVQLWVAWLRAPEWAAPLAAVAVCVPVMFVLQRWIFTPHASY